MYVLRNDQQNMFNEHSSPHIVTLFPHNGNFYDLFC